VLEASPISSGKFATQNWLETQELIQFKMQVGESKPDISKLEPRESIFYRYVFMACGWLKVDSNSSVNNEHQVDQQTKPRRIRLAAGWKI
jgi:hypothetical protein